MEYLVRDSNKSLEGVFGSWSKADGYRKELKGIGAKCFVWVKCPKCDGAGVIQKALTHVNTGWRCFVCHGENEFQPEYFLLGQALSSPHAILPTIKRKNSTEKGTVSGMSGTLEDHIPKVLEGGWVLDKRCVPEDTIIKWVMSGPMVDIDLPAGTRKNWGDPEPGWTVEGIFGDGNPKGLSCASISLDLYLGLWKKLGAKVYQIKDGKAVEA